MTKRLLSAVAVALLSASAAQAATITYTLQVDDGGAGKWGLYAEVSGGGGMAAFNVTLNNALLSTKGLLAPKITYQDGDTDEFGNPVLPDMNAGFTLLRASGANAFGWNITGGQDVPGAGLTPPTATVVYGFGQTAGSLSALPAGYESSTGATSASYAARLKLAGGSYNTAMAHTTVADWFVLNAPNSNNANLFAATGDSTNGVINATLAIAGVASQTNTDSLSATTVASPTATMNVVRLTSGMYVPAVATLNANKGTANIVGPITEAPIWVMAKIEGTDAAAVLAAMPNKGSAAELADLQAKYGTLFPGGSFNALFKFVTPGSAGSFSWDMTGWNAQITALAAVPEPASLGLVALGALGLLARKRK